MEETKSVCFTRCDSCVVIAVVAVAVAVVVIIVQLRDTFYIIIPRACSVTFLDRMPSHVHIYRRKAAGAFWSTRGQALFCTLSSCHALGSPCCVGTV